MRRALFACLAVSLLPLALACTTTKVLKPQGAQQLDATGAKVLLMPLDIELSELTAGGLNAPRADWTQAARGHLGSAIEARIARSHATHVAADPKLLAAESPHLQLFKLHETIGASILMYQVGGAVGGQPLPTLKSGFDWTLGTSVRALAEETNANYALFVFVRDSYATGGRKAAMVGSLLVCGVTGFCMPVATGATNAFASLVDLQSGKVVWFNRFGSDTGDLREGESAVKVTEGLLKGFPL